VLYNIFTEFREVDVATSYRLSSGTFGSALGVPLWCIVDSNQILRTSLVMQSFSILFFNQFWYYFFFDPSFSRVFLFGLPDTVMHSLAVQQYRYGLKLVAFKVRNLVDVSAMKNISCSPRRALVLFYD
jgi:hypothetical protein